MILVTGGAGFIGANFVLSWLTHSDEGVVNLDKLTYAGNLGNLASLAGNNSHVFVEGDIGDDTLVSDLLSQYQPRAIINFAAESHVDRSILGPEAFIDTNVVGLSRLLNCANAYWADLEPKAKAQFRFLQISTDEVYGSLTAEDPAFTEHKAYEPNSPYSASKAAGDHLVRAYHQTYGLPTLTTNCSNNYGPFQFPEKLIPLIIVNALRGDALPIYGDGQQIRDWLFVEDHCSAIECVLDQGSPGCVYNVGGNNEMTNLAVVSAICEHLDELRPKEQGSYLDQITYVTDRPGHDRRYAVDAGRIARELGWQPAETFATGIKKTVDWYLANPDWLNNVQSGEYREWTARNYNNRVL